MLHVSVAEVTDVQAALCTLHWDRSGVRKCKQTRGLKLTTLNKRGEKKGEWGVAVRGSTVTILVITVVHGIDSYIPETNHVSRVYNVGAVMYLLFVLHVMLRVGVAVRGSTVTILVITLLSLSSLSSS